MSKAAKPGWRSAPLVDLATLQRGYDLPVSLREQGDIPIYAANGPVGLHSEAKVHGPGVVTGRSGTIGKVHFVEFDYWPLNTSLFVSDFHGNDPKYVSWFLKWLHLERFHEGTGVPTLNRNNIHNLSVDIPPLPEQKRIAAILDKADAIRKKRKKALELADQFLKSVFLDMFGDPVTNPKGWQKVPLSDLVEFVGGGTPSKNVAEYWDGDICWASSKDIKNDELSDTIDHISEEGASSSPTKMVPPGTILVVVKSKILMHTLPVCMTKCLCCFNQDIKGLKSKNIVQQEYLFQHIRLDQQSLLNMARGVNTEGLTLEHLKSYKVLLPERGVVNKFCEVYAQTKKMIGRVKSGDVYSEQVFSSVSNLVFS